jgi:hypothetical protein
MGGPEPIRASLINMIAPTKIRENLAQVEILLHYEPLETDTRVRLTLAKARLKGELLEYEMRKQKLFKQPSETSR